MATITPSYAASSALTITLASLATSSALLVGRAATQIDNTSNKYSDALLEGFITVGTTPTTATQILVYVWGSNVSLATTAKDSLDGTDAGKTITSAGIANGFLSLATSLLVDSATSDRRYNFGDVSVATVLGLPTLPPYWGVFVTHNTGVNLNSTAGNHAISFSGIKYDVA
jgi:hypothetical protein